MAEEVTTRELFQSIERLASSIETGFGRLESRIGKLGGPGTNGQAGLLAVLAGVLLPTVGMLLTMIFAVWQHSQTGILRLHDTSTEQTKQFNIDFDRERSDRIAADMANDSSSKDRHAAAELSSIARHFEANSASEQRHETVVQLTDQSRREMGAQLRRLEAVNDSFLLRASLRVSNPE